MRQGSGWWTAARGLLAAGLLLAGVACGSAPPPAAAPSTVAPGPAGTVDYDKLVPDAEVTAGLATVRRKAAEVQDAWYGFEATVRRNEKALYLRLEDALADVNAGARDNKAERVARGLQEYDEASQAYLGKHP